MDVMAAYSQVLEDRFVIGKVVTLRYSTWFCDEIAGNYQYEWAEFMYRQHFTLKEYKTTLKGKLWRCTYISTDTQQPKEVWLLEKYFK